MTGRLLDKTKPNTPDMVENEIRLDNSIRGTRSEARSSKSLATYEACESLPISQEAWSPDILISAWAVLDALISDSEAIEIEVVLAGRNTNLQYPKTTLIQGSLDWTCCTVAELLQTVKDQLQHSSTPSQSRKRSHEAASSSKSQFLLIPESNGSSALDYRTLANAYESDLIIIPPVRSNKKLASFDAFFNERMFTRKRVIQLLQQYEKLLFCLASASNSTFLNTLELVPRSDSEQLFTRNTLYPNQIHDCVHYVVHQRVQSQPSAPAVCGWDSSFTYQELSNLADKVAARLVNLGVIPETAVLICFDKSAWAAVAMLAILKAGGAIVAVDPLDSRGRAESIITASKVQIALTNDRSLKTVQGLVEHTLIISADSLAKLPRPDCPILALVEPENTGWIIFTSGSTGKPKGVVLEHSALCTSAEASGNAKHINENSRVFQFSNYIFDGAIQDYFFTFMRGACVCIPSEKDRTDNLAKSMRDMDVNWTFLTPSVVSLLCADDVPSLRVLTLGGEALTSDNVRAWADKVVLQNTYGPAECTVGCCVRQYEDGSGDPKNIGFPIGCIAWVAHPKSHNQLVPQGCVGELLLEGPMLARCYLDDPKTTAHSFIDGPSWLPHRKAHASRRVYKTGDLVRQCDDGSLVFLGRKDSQIKLHGQRVAIADINDFLASSKLVKHAYVAVPNAGYLRNTLTAVVSKMTTAISGDRMKPLVLLDDTEKNTMEDVLEKLRQSLGKIFAKYMIPTTWLLVHDLPFTPTGKIDGVTIKKWLDAMEQPTSTSDMSTNVLSDSSSLHTENLTRTEQEMRRAWSDVLSISPDRIRKDSVFLALGGNSLQAMALTARLRTCDIFLPVTDILRRPTLADMASVAQTSKPSKLVADESDSITLTNLSHSEKVSFASLCGVEPDQIEDVYPAAPFQEALLSLTARDPGAYVVHRRFQILGHVNIARLRAAWLVVTRNNAILRTRIVLDQKSSSQQLVVKDDLSWIDGLNSLSQTSTHKDFTFGAPLLRILISGRSLQVSLHHAIYDGWSMPLLMNDVNEAYATGKSMARPKFKSFVKYLSQRDETKSRAFWRTKLDNTSAIPYPSVPDPSYQPHCIGSITKTISTDPAGMRNITRATLATAAWVLVLSRYTNSEDIVFGLITSGRFVPVDRAAEIIGPMVATVPFRVQLDLSMSKSQFLKQVQDATVDMMPHVHYGLQNINKISPEVRSASKFTNTFIVHPTPVDLSPSKILKPEDVEEVNPADYRTYPLHVSCTLLEEGRLEAKMRFDPNIISDSQTQHLLDYFEDVLLRLGASGSRSVITLKDTLQPSSNLLRALTTTPFEEPVTVRRCVHDLITTRATEKPEAPAISSWDASLTYAELDDLSNRLAGHLRARGIVPECHVCFSFEKSSLPVIAVLGIMKAGGACVPLDISYPEDRIKTVVDKCQAKIIVCSRKQASIFRRLGLDQIECVVIGHEMLSQLEARVRSASDDVTPNNAAYAIFTSGSTGIPKGCSWSHTTLASSSMAHGKAMSMSSMSRVFQFSAFMWDISVCETITTLVHGGCVCIPSEEDRLDRTVETMNEMKITWAWFTPTFARSVNLKDAKHLETLVLGGEVIGQDNVDTYRGHFRLLTGYGPSECCVAVSVADFTANSSLKSGNIGVGVGCHLWVVDPLDPHSLVPSGAVGEVIVEGPIVGRGYLQDPDRTAENFVTDLAWALQSSKPDSGQRRFYRTGDLGRLSEDGSVTFIGRKDDQVKVRGQRLELGEVEHHLLQCPEVKNAMAFLPKETTHQGKLTAVVVMDTGPTDVPPRILQPLHVETQAIESIKGILANKLPPFGIPSVWLPVHAVPLTPAGKLDRQRVRRWALEILSSSSSSSAIFDSANNTVESGSPEMSIPTTPREMALQHAWSEVLNVPHEKIGAMHSFVQLQGDSIHAIKVVSLLRSRGHGLAVRDMFQYPVLKEMATHISIITSVSKESPLSERKLDLFPSAVNKEKMLSETARSCGISRDKIEDIYMSTPVQEAMMTLNIVSPGTYFAQLVYEGPSELEFDPSTLKKAWRTVTNAHPILRTRLVDLSTMNLGMVEVVVKGDLSFVYAPTEDLATFLRKDSVQRIELGDAMARLSLVGHRIVLSMHHSVYDGFSLPMIVEDLMRIYAGDEAKPRTPFRNFVEYLSTNDSHVSEQFWSSYLSDFTPGNFPRLPKTTSRSKAGSSKRIDLSFARQQIIPGITTATIANAAWGLLLSSYSDSSDISFGTTFSGRDVPVRGIADLSGPTLATVPLRFKIDRKVTVAQLLRQIQASNLDVMAHQHLGVQKIKHVSAEAAAACEFKTLFIIFPPEEDDHGEAGLKLQRQWSTGDVDNFSMYPLAVLFKLSPYGARIAFNYNEDLISKEMIDRLAVSYDAIFRRLVSSTESMRVNEIMDISEQDRKDILHWNENISIEAKKGFVHQLVSANARRQPSQTAVSAWDGDFTYVELDNFSTHLAWHLDEMGVREGAFVAFCMNKSKWTIVAMLAILKANAAFVPLNPQDSVERKRQLIGSCEISTLLVSSDQYAEHKEATKNVVRLDQACFSLPLKLNPLPSTITGNSRAWMIFTSGSTGKPKGVVIIHSAFTTSILTLSSALGINESTRCLQFASHVFDLSNMEIYCPLAHGGVICIPSEEERLSDLSNAVSRMRVNSVVLTPTVLRSLRPQDFPSFTKVILGGEVVGAELISTWADKVSLFSVWAPSETTMANTVIRLHDPNQSAELGKLVNAKLWLLQTEDPNLLAPIGATGEIAVEGAVLAEGYLGDEKRTKESFVQGLKWAGDDNRKFYRTGDVAYYETGGRLRFLGRRDAQVKVRGQRLELGDVEHHLNKHAEVQDAVALVPKAGPFKGQLMAILSLERSDTDQKAAKIDDDVQLLVGTEFTEVLSNIEHFLREVLPSHAVPSVFIPLLQLSRTSSGKVNRVRLQHFASNIDHETMNLLTNTHNSTDNADQPKTATEQKLQEIWADVLNVSPERIGRSVSFFQLGGDSITAMNVVSRIRAVGGSLTVQTMMKSKTIAKTAEGLTFNSVNRASEALEEDETGVSFDLSPIQRVFVGLGSVETRFNQSFMLKTKQEIGLPQMRSALRAIVECHSMLRTRLRRSEKGNSWQQIIYPASEKDFALFSATSRSRANVEAAIDQAQACINLKDGPAIAVAVIKTPEACYCFLTAHHMVIDLVSWRVVMHDLEAKLLDRQGSPIRPMRFRYWLESQRRYIQEMAQKRKTLPFTIPPPNMAFWSVRAADNVVQETKRTSFILDEKHTGLLFGAANKALSTEPIELLLAGVWIAFARSFPERLPPPIFTEAHGREAWDASIDLSRTVGWFTTLQPLLLENLSADAEILEVVKHMKDVRRLLSGNGWAVFTNYASDKSKMEEFFGGSLPVEVIFNFAGSFQQLEREDSLFQLVPAGQFKKMDFGNKLGRLGIFEFEAFVQGKELNITLSYNRHVKNASRVLGWMDQLQASLAEMALLLERSSLDFTLSDFPLLNVNHEQLQSIIATLPEHGIKDLHNVEDIYPCSSFVDLMAGGQKAFPEYFNLRWTVKISSANKQSRLEPSRLLDAWVKVVKRHTALKTIVFEKQTEQSAYQQVILRDFSPQVFQVEAINDADAKEKLEKYPSLLYATDLPKHGFGVCQVPETGEVYVRVELNHSYMDGGSMGVIWRDLCAAYNGTLGDAQAPSYKEYITYLLQRPIEDNNSYWRRYLEGVQSCKLPTGPKPTEEVLQGEDKQVLTEVGDRVDVSALNSFCRTHGVTIPSMLQTAWALVYATYLNRKSVAFFYVNSGRDVDIPGVEKMVGAILSTLPCRVEIQENETLAELVARMQNDHFNNLEHQHFNFLKTVFGLDISNSALSIQAQTAILPEQEGGICFEHVHANDFAGGDYLFTMSYAPDRISLLLKHRRIQTTDEWARGIAEMFVRILETIVQRPEERYASADLWKNCV